MSGFCRLYLVTPAAFVPERFVDTLASALDVGGVACLQLRLKGVDDDEIRRACATLMPICHAHEVALIVNDRPDLAAEMGADGTHLGQDDAEIEDARALLGPDRIIGVTCHDSRHLAMEAGEAGADYVAFGAFFPSTTKDARRQASIEIIRWWSQLMTVPAVAIGGITVANCRPIVEAGADFVAVSAGVWANERGPADAVRAFNAVFREVMSSELDAADVAEQGAS